jgi:hypothetical protein
VGFQEGDMNCPFIAGTRSTRARPGARGLPQWGEPGASILHHGGDTTLWTRPGFLGIVAQVGGQTFSRSLVTSARDRVDEVSRDCFLSGGSMRLLCATQGSLVAATALAGVGTVIASGASLSIAEPEGGTRTFHVRIDAGGLRLVHARPVSLESGGELVLVTTGESPARLRMSRNGLNAYTRAFSLASNGAVLLAAAERVHLLRAPSAQAHQRFSLEQGGMILTDRASGQGPRHLLARMDEGVPALDLVHEGGGVVFQTRQWHLEAQETRWTVLHLKWHTDQWLLEGRSVKLL